MGKVVSAEVFLLHRKTIVLATGLWTSGTGKRSRDRKAYRREWALWLGRGDSTPEIYRRNAGICTVCT